MKLYESIKNFFSYFWDFIRSWFFIWCNYILCTICFRWAVEYFVKDKIFFASFWCILFINYLHDLFKSLDEKKAEKDDE